ncbi:hypothetical protein TrST_g8653 [Triparma strigata]|uniref:Magnesium transporter n=1 Tax=Triparma strigata TaxID=1606541 RepID=A0A9W7EJM8_9STRA|nr:hypothetical protein TrST_g8653 [Triparma strigata]
MKLKLILLLFATLTLIHPTIASSGYKTGVTPYDNHIVTEYPNDNSTFTKTRKHEIEWVNNYKQNETHSHYVKLTAWRLAIPSEAQEVIEESVIDTGSYSWEVPIYMESASDWYILIEDITNPSSYGVAPEGVEGREDSEQPTFTIRPAPANLLWLFGVFLSIIASILSNLGVNLQKLSMMRESSERAASEKRSYITQPLWLIGLATLIIGSVGDFAALGFAPQSLMTPVGGFTLVCNAVFAHYFLSETLTRKDKVGTFNIIVGIIVLATFGAKSNTSYTIDELLKMYATGAFLAYVIAVASAVGFFYYCYWRASHIVKKYGKQHEKYKPFKKLHPLSCSALSGCLGAQSILCAKSVAEMFKESLSADGANQFVNVETWLIVLGMVFFVFSQIHWLARGLESFDAVYIVPVFQCFFISVAVIGGAVYFREFDDMADLNRFMFFVGLMITLSGVYLLSQRDMSKLKPKQRFRAQVFVVIFMLRTQKVVRRKKELDRLEMVAESSMPDPSLPMTSLPGAIPEGSGAIVQPERSPREERKSLEDAEKDYAVMEMRKQLGRMNRNSATNVNLPIMQVTAVVDKSKKRVEGKIRDKIIDPTLETLDHVGDAIKAGVGKVRIAPSSQPTSPEQMAEDLEMGTIDDAATAYKVPKESKQGDHEANLKTPPKTDAGLV